MGGRYYITGVQIGMLRAFNQLVMEQVSGEVHGLTIKLREVLEEIEKNQYLCNAGTEDWEQIVSITGTREK